MPYAYGTNIFAQGVAGVAPQLVQLSITLNGANQQILRFPIWVVVRGNTASSTITLPQSTLDGTTMKISNLASVAWTLQGANSSQVDGASSITVQPGTSLTLTFILGTGWVSTVDQKGGGSGNFWTTLQTFTAGAIIYGNVGSWTVANWSRALRLGDGGSVAVQFYNSVRSYGFGNASGAFYGWSTTSDDSSGSPAYWLVVDDRVYITDKVLQPSAGITFGQSTLSWYEEGTYTFNYLGSSSDPTITWAGRAARFQRIGNRVLCDFDVTSTASTGGSGDTRVTTPFAMGGSSVGVGWATTMFSGGLDAHGVVADVNAVAAPTVVKADGTKQAIGTFPPTAASCQFLGSFGFWVN